MDVSKVAKSLYGHSCACQKLGTCRMGLLPHASALSPSQFNKQPSRELCYVNFVTGPKRRTLFSFLEIGLRQSSESPKHERQRMRTSFCEERSETQLFPDRSVARGLSVPTACNLSKCPLAGSSSLGLKLCLDPIHKEGRADSV